MNAMKRRSARRQRDRRRCCRGTPPARSSRRDAQRVEEALARDPELARRYALVREELGETIHLNETLGAPSARAMEKLFAKIDAEPARSECRSLNLGARVAEFFASLSPRTLALVGERRRARHPAAGRLASPASWSRIRQRRLRDGLRRRPPIRASARSPHPLCAAGDVGRHQQVPRGQQTLDRRRADGRRTVQSSRRGNRACRRTSSPIS